MADEGREIKMAEKMKKCKIDGEYLKDRLSARDITQTAAGKMLGRGGSYISSICARGEMVEPQADLLCRILDIDKKRLVIQEETEAAEQEPAADQTEITTLLRQIDEKLLKLIYLISYKQE